MGVHNPLAAAVVNTPAGNLAAANVQAALNELQSDIDTRATAANLTAHTGAASGAHAASAISNAPSGNLAATTVQAALNELQTDVDTRITESMTLIGTLATTSGASQTLSGLNLTGYKALKLVGEGVSLSGAGTPRFMANAGANNIGGDLGSAGAHDFNIEVNLSNGAWMCVGLSASNTAGAYRGVSGPTNASASFTFYASSGAFDAGQVRAYGVK